MSSVAIKFNYNDYAIEMGTCNAFQTIFAGWTKTHLYIYLSELIEMELLLLESTKKNQLQTYKLLYNDENQNECRFMLGSIGVHMNLPQ